MADALAVALMECGYSKKIVVTRDPSHCTDLGPKDLVHDKFLSPVIDKGWGWGRPRFVGGRRRPKDEVARQNAGI